MALHTNDFDNATSAHICGVPYFNIVISTIDPKALFIETEHSHKTRGINCTEPKEKPADYLQFDVFLRFKLKDKYN